jgi:hypothetical protein
MARVHRKKLEFPVGGLNKAAGITNQSPYFAAACNNFWPIQWNTGRARGGTRLGVDSFNSLGVPRNWAPVTWESDSGGQATYRGIAVACAGGVYVSTGGSFSQAITDSASSDFTSCAIFNNLLFQARGGQDAKVRELTTPGTGAGTTVNAAWSEGYAETPGSGTNGGTPPTNCGLVAVHQNRVVFAGDTVNPQVLYMSRAGYPKDWDYAQTDSGAAWATSGGSSGKIGQPITALIEHTQGCLIIGCTDSMYVVRGNPTTNNALDVFVHGIGPLSQSAWCKTTNGWTFFLSRDGLYKIPPGCPGPPPEPVSRKLLPEELVAINPATSGTYVSLAYDSRWQGIHIYVNTSGSNTYYFYDLVHEGFWPMTFSQTLRLGVNFPVAAEATESAMLAIDSSGSSYQFTTDSTENIASSCAYGPFQLVPNGLEGIINEVSAVLAENSSAVSWKLYVADSAAEAYALLVADAASFTGVAWATATTDGPSGAAAHTRLSQYVQNPMRRGQVAYLKIYASGTTARISVEEINATCVDAGLRRVL